LDRVPLRRIGTNDQRRLARQQHDHVLYQGNDVYTYDPAGNWKVFAMDAFGNLVIVGEPDPTLLGLVWSYYGYDVLNHLATVTMPRGSNTQSRTFSYNTGTTVTGLLQSATNPENGTVYYTYTPTIF
jgi:hypothetical protein